MSLDSPLLPAGATLSVPVNPLPCASSSSSLSPSLSATLESIPSLYVTFKVVQLVNTFRKRVKTRVHSAKRDAPKRVAESFCRDFEREAYDEIDRYLGRKPLHPLSKRKNVAKPVATVTEDQPSGSIELLLDHINHAVKSESHSLAKVAASDKLFIQRRTLFTVSLEHLSLRELTALLVVVKDLLKTLRRGTSTRKGAKTLCEGNEVLDSQLDETYLANLEHLLLCLKNQLLRLLIAKLVEVVHKHVLECQRDQSKRSEEWFFEFPDARHPLSTTWPWSIKPSLAVLWGVCWMFYDYNDTNNSSNLPPDDSLRAWWPFDENGNMVNEQGDVVAESYARAQFFNNNNAIQRPQPQGFNPVANRQDFGFVPRQSFRNVYAPMGTAPHESRGLHSSMGSHQPSTSRGESRVTPTSQRQVLPVPRSAALLTQQAGANPHVARASAGPAIAGTNNTYSAAAAAPPSYDAPPASASNNNWLPEDDFTAGLALQPSEYPADVGPWPHLPAQSLPEQQQATFVSHADVQALPPGSRNLLTPALRVTTHFSDLPNFQQAPQDTNYYSPNPGSSISSAASHHDQAAYYPNLYPAQHLSPQQNPFMTAEQQQDMQVTPPRSPHHGTTIGEQVSRKRSHSVMSGGAQQPPISAGSRSGSIASLQPHSPEDEYSSPRHRAFKRGEPPMNPEHKYICDFSEDCAGLTFDRKCEWSKHMDKHDRPYRCQHASCAKLQGFTYSGGLLRHEREVHGKHGGPKATLRCPHEDCKRHSGKGFTRKENLNEHIRRVHQSKDQQSQMNPLKRDATDVLPGADEGETPASEGIDPEDPTSPTHKRRRYTLGTSDRSASEDVEDLKQEVKRLREENAKKDARFLSLQEEMRLLRESVGQLQQQGQGQG